MQGATLARPEAVLKGAHWSLKATWRKEILLGTDDPVPFSTAIGQQNNSHVEIHFLTAHYEVLLLREVSALFISFIFIKILNMNVHFIAIGGSAMHNLAIALSRKGDKVTGSDDEIFEPSKSRLAKEGILPETIGWSTDNIHEELDAVIVGMHARADNPELLKAEALGLPIFSYPEYIYEKSKDKKRIVIGGSHGKTTTTSMLLHAVKALGKNVDYMVGAQLEGYDCMVKLSDEADTIVLEGDEYLSSPLDRRPKFHLYEPHVAMISGIAWDHINVFPTFENYVEQFEIFTEKIVPGGVLVYNTEDEEVRKIGERNSVAYKAQAYQTPAYTSTPTGSILHFEGKDYPLQIFGAHNLQNLMGAMYLAQEMGIRNEEFLSAMKDFTGAGKRLEKVYEKEDFVMFKDFAHSPSKLKATTKAVKEQFADRKVIACMELHTFSSLKKEFLPQYKGAMAAADKAIVYFNHEVVAHKKLAPITKEEVLAAFGGNVEVYTQSEAVIAEIRKENMQNVALLMMSSGNFDGVDYAKLAEELVG
ncbi:UDP-N-acetylmuramate: L-alanyl-gamma-D-glutamyl-meso-diaminopimelate ligase [Lishizhenia tianjinensis]|uniref:UDP-N-acetylmuramate: L-alanyl-gamma-D-glutamyl-meso-diaminopimelate ligase n=2 Tax=Lishizhenia tianjinensis TaxID=477690 RepID=A0A1I6YA76_9FLAO|nr:UDP-N-acetylmuramate: L-alanyl-gamma-D-glutamyl-meso-diaminopimelate ligase [Lishizhenia tianjinensis]